MIIKLRPIMIGAAIVCALGAGIWQMGSWSTQVAERELETEPSVIPAAGTSWSQEESFFPYYRLQREKVRSQQLEILKEIINNPNTDEKSKQSAFTKLLAITNVMEMELKVEGLLKARGFQEGVVIIQEEGASVVISAQAFDEEKEARLKEGVAGVLKINSTQIDITNRQ
ncbi:MAG: SpoIIIAH-like family protein [Syntrophomonadaceae bacterium]|nr:SpoIIIAH-like family protein [Syntrophomonadaceae bacterium]